MKNKRLYYGFLVVIGICSTYTFLYLTPHARIHQVEREYVAAVEHLNQSPPGIQRAEEYLQRLRAINTQHAPSQIQQDLRDYTDTVEQSLNVLKAGGDASVFDKKFAEEKAKLDADFLNNPYP
jgi:hypothetical protein